LTCVRLAHGVEPAQLQTHINAVVLWVPSPSE
jgi:hypothetical protein